MLAVVGALSFWLPDVIIHFLARRSFDSPHVWAITLVSPTTFLVAYLSLRRIAAHRDYRALGIAMMLGVWFLGGLFMIAIATAAGGFAGPNRIGTVFMFLLFSWFPPLTWIMATYDGSLGALVIVTLGVLLFWSIRRYRPHAVADPVSERVTILGGIIVGLAVSSAILVLMGFGVSGVLRLENGTDLMYVLWPSSLILVGGWRTTAAGILITVFSVAANCAMYVCLALALRFAIRVCRRFLTAKS